MDKETFISLVATYTDQRTEENRAFCKDLLNALLDQPNDQFMVDIIQLTEIAQSGKDYAKRGLPSGDDLVGRTIYYVQALSYIGFVSMMTWLAEDPEGFGVGKLMEQDGLADADDDSSPD